MLISDQTIQKNITFPSHYQNLNRHFKYLMTQLFDLITFTANF